MRIRKVALTVLAAIICLFSFCIFACAGTETSIKGGDFELDEGLWSEYLWLKNAGSVRYDETVSHSGNGSVHITCTDDNDVRVYQTVSVTPCTFYTVKAFVKTKNIKSTAVGATISVMNESVISESVTGTNDWRELTFSFATEEGRDSVDICLTLGGYGSLNSGEAWFDSVTIEEVSSKPRNCKILESEVSKTSTGKKKNYAGFELNDSPDDAKWTFFAFLIITILSLLLIMFATTDKFNADGKKTRRIFIGIMITAFVFRLVAGMYSTGFSYDISCFKAWSYYAASDLFNMYSKTSSMFLDYPPLYMYMLAPVGVIANSGYVIGEPLALFVLKLPSVIADLLSVWLIYSFAKKNISSRWALVLSAFYAFNPMVWLDSVVWGQVDSIFAFFVIAEIICIYDKKWWGMGIFFALSVLLKPHGIIFAPAIGMALLTELIRNKKIRPLLEAVCAGIVSAAVLLLPFYIRTNFENPTWIIELYTGTVGSYPYATLNGYNFWALLGYNATSVDSIFCGLTFGQWGTLSIVITCVLAVVFSVLGTRKNNVCRESYSAVVALFVVVAVFTFAQKMHERYLFAAVAVAIVAFIETKEKGFVYLALFLSCVTFLNMYQVLDLNIMWSYPYAQKNDLLMIFTSFLEVTGYVWTLALTIKTLILNNVSKPLTLLEEEGTKE